MSAMVLAGVGWLIAGAAAVVATIGLSVPDSGYDNGDGAFGAVVLILVVVAALAPANVAVIAWFSRFTATAWVFAGLAVAGLALGGLVLLIGWGDAIY